MAQYVLQLTCKLGGTPDENEGVFDTVAWASPTQRNPPNPSTASLPANAGDTIGIGIQVRDSNGAQQNAYLDWVAVIWTATTQPGNRSSRLADNNSPFRIGSGTKPNTVLLSNKTGAGQTDMFQGYDNNGNTVTSGATFLGMPLESVVKDVPPGRSSPNRATSRYEAVVVCSLTDPSGATWQFGFDPEMDVSNGN